jgi:hypothetical protein
MIMKQTTTRANVGIGSNDPDATLHVLQTRDSSWRGLLVDGGWDFDGTGGADLVRFYAGEPLQDDADLLDIYAGDQLSSDAAQYIECHRETGSGDEVQFRVDLDGNVYCDGAFFDTGADLAEMMRASAGAAALEAGDVLIIDPASTRAVARSSELRSTLVAGVYSTRPGLVCSNRGWDEPGRDGGGGVLRTLSSVAAEFDEIPVAVVGIVPCKVSAENGPVRVGDLLVTSGIPGHAMRDENPRAGTILGKALEPLAAGTGVIEVLVTLQ